MFQWLLGSCFLYFSCTLCIHDYESVFNITYLCHASNNNCTVYSHGLEINPKSSFEELVTGQNICVQIGSRISF